MSLHHFESWNARAGFEMSALLMSSSQKSMRSSSFFGSYVAARSSKSRIRSAWTARSVERMQRTIMRRRYLNSARSMPAKSSSLCAISNIVAAWWFSSTETSL
eukprot:Amastigsp_a848125_7.p3 type:complete len:103 gc:universal Amastigsp_a848125_7:319-627(+)